jgi:bifunctional DNA-binding transcriptional regulator/antitoxin component of YhaV-PrlF toxin-antitoxin module
MTEPTIVVRITKDGQIPLPEQVRKELGLVPQQEVRLLKRGGELVIQPVPSDPSRQEQIETILRRAKLHAAALADQVSSEEAWAIYDRAAATLGQALHEGQPEG